METFGLLLGILAINGLLRVPMLVLARRRAGRLTETARDEVAGTKERLVREPETAPYAAARTGSLGVMRTTAVVALTDRRLLVRPLLGHAADVALDAITRVSTNTWFHGSYRNGRTYVILKLRDGREVAVAPADPRRWVASLPPARG